MKTFCETILITGFILISINGILAQKIDNKLNQAGLMKQFVGSWKCELGKDTIMIGDNMAFGTGLVCNSQIIVKAKIINSMRYFLPLCHCAAAHYPELAEG